MPAATAEVAHATIAGCHRLRRRVQTAGTRRSDPMLTSQAIGMLLRNQLYAGIVDVPEYGVRGKRGDFELLISEDLFYRAQAVLSGRLPSTMPKQRAHRDVPLRGFVRGEACYAASLTADRKAAASFTRSAASRRRGRTRTSDNARRRRLVPRRGARWSRGVATGGSAPCAGSVRRCGRRGGHGRQR
jgi:hypothetical protein